MKNTNDDDEYKNDTLQHRDGNESVDNPETSDTTIKSEEALIKRLMSMIFNHHITKYVIDIVTLFGGEMI